MTRLVLALLAMAAVWWTAVEVATCIVYRYEQRMLEDRLRQLGEVRRHEDAVSRQHEGSIPPWK